MRDRKSAACFAWSTHMAEHNVRRDLTAFFVAQLEDGVPFIVASMRSCLQKG